MAKGQKRGNKEPKKPKSTEKRTRAGPKYLAASDLSRAGKSPATRLVGKK